VTEWTIPLTLRLMAMAFLWLDSRAFCVAATGPSRPSVAILAALS
jgi:hypothetical protein